MAALVIAEHDKVSIKGATLNTITAALQCGGEVHVLVAGAHAGAAAAAAYSGDRDRPFRSIVTGCAACKSCAAPIVLRALRTTPNHVR